MISMHDFAMHAEAPVLGKRVRTEDSEDCPLQGFGEHRGKRRQLPFRRSPEARRRSINGLATYQQPPRSPNVADITPVGSDSEDMPRIQEPKSFFSPWSSSAGSSMIPSSQVSPCCGSSQSTEMLDAPVYSDDDHDMTESTLLYPGLLHADSTTTMTGRIPTPMHASFSYLRPDQKLVPRLDYQMGGSSGDYAGTESDPGLDQRSRRLPSPISEDGKNSSATEGAISEMQVDVEDSEEMTTTPQKGHSRSKHSLRNWGSMAPEIPLSTGKKFSMGYRSDCEKCQMKVPGHFSHIITY